MSDDDYASTRRHWWVRKAGMVSCLACATRLGWAGAKEGCPLWTTPEDREANKGFRVSEAAARDLMAVLSKQSDGPTYTCEPSYEINLRRRG